MSLSTITLWAGLVLSLPLPTSQSCIQGTARECKEAEFVPGSNLAGEGFDIVKMQRKGAFIIDMNTWSRRNQKTCTLCRNPYLAGKMQKLPASAVDWRPSQQCSMKLASTLHLSSESLVSSSTSSVENNWKVNLGINTHRGQGSLMLAGTQSKMAEYSMEKTKRDKFSFTSHKVSCGFYSYRVSNQPLLHPEFKHAVKNLPMNYTQESKQRYYKLIDNFGTHYITKVRLGGMVRSVTSIKQCQAALQGLRSEEVKTCLDVEVAASIMSMVDMRAERKHCQEAKDKTESKSSFSSSFNDRFTEIFGGHTTEPELLFSADKDPSAYKDWLSSLPLFPDVLSYSLEPLHELLPGKSPVRKHLRKAICDYILQNALWRNCSSACKAGVKTNPKEPCVCSCNNNPEVTPDCCPSRLGVARVSVTVARASGLWGDTITSTDGYVKVFNKDKMLLGRTPVIWNNNSPNWGWSLELGNVVLSGKLRFEVWDEDSKWDDDLLGACEAALTAGVQKNFCQLNHGELFYKTEVACAPSLAGPSCSEYVESPMNSHLEKAYVSRHARPVPNDMLVKMGVLVDEHPLHANQNGNRHDKGFDL